LKCVQDVQDSVQPRCVDGSVGIAVKVIANLQDPAEAFKGLGVARVFAELRFEKGLADLSSDRHRKSPQVLLARTHENRGFDRAQ
jgi:hypothetical protein